MLQSFLDEDSSTLPGYPKIPLMTNHTSMSKFPSENDRSYCVVIDAIKGFLEFAPTRQLWKAIDLGSISSIQMMLDLGADPNLQDIKGESALHKAVRRNGSAIQIIRTLLWRGADIDLKDTEENTVLSIAESESKDDIARFLRRNGATREFWDMKKIGNEHPHDKIYMDGPSHNSNIERWDPEVLDSTCEDACRKSTLSITYFSQRARGTPDRYRSKTSVFNALYDEHSSKESIGNALTKYQKVKNLETKSASFTWYHLPANNVSQPIPNLTIDRLYSNSILLDNRWHGSRYVIYFHANTYCPDFVFQKLFTLIFKDWLDKDAAEALRSLRSLSGEQHGLNTSNFLYMRPDCRTVDLKFAAKQQQMAQQVGKQYAQSFISLKHKQGLEIEQKVALKLFVRGFIFTSTQASPSILEQNAYLCE